MEKHPLSQSTHEEVAQVASVFAFPELFSVDMRLLLDIETHTAILLSQKGGDAYPQFRLVPLTPASASIFLTLLQAYPLHCSHRSLYRALYPSPERADDDGWWEHMKDLALPMIRRALKTLAPALRTCGLQVVSLRGQGYLLAPIATSKKHQEEASDTRSAHPSCYSFSMIRAPCALKP